MGKELIKSDIKLTIGILVSNNIKYIQKVLEAIKPLLDVVSSELIVIDTKGEETDGSIAVAREYTDRIYPFVWCNDFAAARNVCLEHARGEWFLYLDDDECFDDVMELIDFFQNGECELYNSGTYYVRNYDSKGNYSLSIVGRMIRRRENTCFEGRVHESFNEIYAPRKNFSCFVHHYGYVFDTLEEAKKHQERNVSILEKELAETGETPSICAQLVQELINYEDTAEQGYLFAVDVLNRNNGQEWIGDSCAQWIMLATVRYYIQKKDYKKAKEQYRHINEKYELNRMSCMALHGMMADIALEEQDNENMLYHAEQYMRQFDWKLANEDEALNQMNLDVPRYAEQNYCVRILKIGAVAAGKLSRKKELHSFLERLPDSEKEATEEEENKISDMKNINNFQCYNVIEKDEQLRPRLIKSDIKLTIGILVSNHIEYIRKAMDSLKPLLEAIPSELVVLDTMGDRTDGSIDIVREYTDKVYPFTWCDDFSAARNVLLEHAHGEWFLYMDDDEWFDDVQEFIDFFRSGESESFYSGYYYTRDYLPDGKYSLGIAGRMVRRTDNTKFIGKIHETFNVMYAPNKQFSCFTHHYGYAYANEAERERKQKRNVSILKAELNEKGLSPQRAAQMVQELISREATLEEGYRFCLESIGTLEKQKELKNSCSQWLLVAMVRCFAGKDNQEVLEQAEYVCANYELTQVGAMVLAATVVTVAAAEGNCEFVKKYGALYLSNWDWKKEHEEEALMQTNLDFPKFLTEEQYYYVVHMCAVAANFEGDYIRANLYWKRMPWGTEGFDGGKYANDLNATVQGMKIMQGQKTAELRVLLQTLLEACEYTGMSVLKGEYGELTELLFGMQEMAIAIGQSIDEHFGEGTEEVHVLEEFCECVWQCSQTEESDKLVTLLEEGSRMIKGILEKEKP